MDRSLYLTISERLGLVESLPTLPEVVSRVVEMIDAPETTSEMLAEVVGADAAIVARLMRVANSILYSGARGATDSLDEAIMRLGFAGVRDLVLTTGVIETFDTKVADFDYQGFWQHCATTGMAAGDLAAFAAKAGRPTSTPGNMSGPYFLAGLLHDLGVMACLDRLGSDYQLVLEKNTSAQEPLYVTEREVMGFDHAQVGAALAQRWELPEAVAAAAEWHHVPMEAPEPYRDLASLVHVADWFTHHLGLGKGRDGNLVSFDERASDHLKLDLLEFTDVVASLMAASEHCALLVGPTD